MQVILLESVPRRKRVGGTGQGGGKVNKGVVSGDDPPDVRMRRASF